MCKSNCCFWLGCIKLRLGSKISCAIIEKRRHIKYNTFYSQSAGSVPDGLSDKACYILNYGLSCPPSKGENQQCILPRTFEIFA